MARKAHEDLDERLLHRMLFFTDAVFAIVLTLLALELKGPVGAAAANAATLREVAPHIGAFAFSFFIISVFWTAHMNTTRLLAHFDWPTALANVLFLLPVCLLPFATSWIGADLSGGFAWALYCWVLVAISTSNVVVVLAAYRGGGRLIAGGTTPRDRLYRIVRAAGPGMAFAVGLLILTADQPILAHFCWLLIPITSRLAGLLLRPRPAPRAA